MLLEEASSRNDGGRRRLGSRSQHSNLLRPRLLLPLTLALRRSSALHDSTKQLESQLHGSATNGSVLNLGSELDDPLTLNLNP